MPRRMPIRTCRWSSSRGTPLWIPRLSVRLGAADYLSKPFSLGQIDVMIQRLTERVLLEKENRELTDSIAPRSDAEIVGRLDSIGARIDRVETCSARWLQSL